MAIAYTDIARVLDGARRRQGWIVFATALGWGTAAALLGLLAGVCALAAGWAPVPVRHATLAAAVIAGVCALAWTAVALIRRASSPDAVARTVGRAAPDLRGDLVSSVELEQEYEELLESRRFSVALVDEHIARTAARTRGLDLARVVAPRRAHHRRCGAHLHLPGLHEASTADALRHRRGGERAEGHRGAAQDARGPTGGGSGDRDRGGERGAPFGSRSVEAAAPACQGLRPRRRERPRPRGPLRRRGGRQLPVPLHE